MTYAPNKKIFAICLSLILLSGNAFAQSNTEAMRFLMVNAMMQYGQKLYERGDFDEATAVFNHVLVYDHRQPQAISYLKQMGQGPTDTHDIDSLRHAIEAKKRNIEKLKEQIRQMRANLALSSEN